MPIFSEYYPKAVENTSRSNSCPAIRNQFGVNSDLNTSSRMQSHSSDDHLNKIGKKLPTMWDVAFAGFFNPEQASGHSGNETILFNRKKPPAQLTSVGAAICCQIWKHWTRGTFYETKRVHRANGSNFKLADAAQKWMHHSW